MNMKSALAFAFCISFLCASASSLHAQTLSEKEFNDLRNGSISSCFRTQKASALNTGISDQAIRNYCVCFTNVMIPTHITVQEVKSAMVVLQSAGVAAFVEFLLKGRDLYEISENCAARTLK